LCFSAAISALRSLEYSLRLAYENLYKGVKLYKVHCLCRRNATLWGSTSS
jgi:hypothetical protein